MHAEHTLYLAVHRKDANARPHDEVDEVALALGEVLVAPVAKGGNGKAPGGLLVALQRKKVPCNRVHEVYFLK